jgi:hypothetical protein
MVNGTGEVLAESIDGALMLLIAAMWWFVDTLRFPCPPKPSPSSSSLTILHLISTKICKILRSVDAHHELLNKQSQGFLEGTFPS